MSIGFKITGKGDLDDIFDPYVAGTKAAATNFRIGSQDLRDRYAPRALGADIGFDTNMVSGGKDLRQLFAAKGSINYALGFDGQSYDAVAARTAATLILALKPDGTWTVTNQRESVLASGTWLNYGGVANDYTVKFAGSGFTDGDETGYSNGASTPSTLTTTCSFAASAAAKTIGNTAQNRGTVTAYLYKSGVLLSTSACTFQVTSNDF